MKKSAIALALIATTAQAEIHLDGEHLYILSNEIDSNGLVVSVEAAANCKPFVDVMVDVGTQQNESHTFEAVEFSRVDRKTKRTWNATVTHGGTWQLIKLGFIDNAQVADMRRGNTMRVKYNGNGSDIYRSYNMAGFSAAYSKLKAQCTPSASYFDDEPAKPASQKNELFL